MSQEPITTIEQLVAARETRGVSVEDMVRQLKLAPRQLRALEEGDWQALPGLAFTRAVLRSYGRVLGVDVGPLVGSMSPSVPEADLKPASTLHQPMPARSMFGFGSGGGGNRLAWFVLIVLGVVALALFFGGESKLGNVRSWLAEFRTSTGEGSEQKADAPERAGAGATAVEPAAIQDAGKAGTSAEATSSRATASATPSATPAQRPQADTPSAAAAPGGGGAAAPKTGDASVGIAAAPASDAGSTPVSAAATQAPTPSAAPAARPAPAGAAVQASPGGSTEAKPDAGAVGGRAVKLVFQRDSWVEARDADGKVLFTGTQKAGTEHQFTASGPVSMIIGNAEFVRAEVDGKPFDLVPHTRAAIARVTLR